MKNCFVGRKGYEEIIIPFESVDCIERTHYAGELILYVRSKHSWCVVAPMDLDLYEEWRMKQD